MLNNFNQLVAAFLADCRHTVRVTTLRQYGHSLATFARVVPDTEHRHVTRADLLAFRTARLDHLAVNSVNREVSVVVTCLRWGELNDLAPAVQTRRLKLRHESTARALTHAELKRVLAAADGTIVEWVVRIAHATGLRSGEIRRIRFRDVDFRRGTVSVVGRPGWQPKTKQALRTIPCPELVAQLREAGFAGRPDALLIGEKAERRIHEQIRAVFKAARVSVTRPIHSIRHLFASDLCEAGVPIHVAAKLLGHSDPAITLAIYAHSNQRAETEAMERLARHRAA